MSGVARILSAIEQGDAQAADKSLLLVYRELRKLPCFRQTMVRSFQLAGPGK